MTAQSDGDHHHLAGKTYILTTDLVEAASYSGWELPRPEVEACEKRLVELIDRHLLPAQIKLEVLSQSRLQQSLRIMLYNRLKEIDPKCCYLETEGSFEKFLLKHTSAFLVSLDPTIAPWAHQFAITRVCDSHSFSNGYHDTRPGCLSLAEQAAEVAQLANGRPIVLLDDGYWKGTTFEKVMGLLRAHGVTVEAAITPLYIKGDDPPVCELMSNWWYPKQTNLDWVCLRDLVPGWPLSGRTIAQPTDGLSRGINYVEDEGLGFGSLDDFIPEYQITAFQAEAVRIAIDLFKIVEDALGRPVTAEIMERVPLHYAGGPSRRFIDYLESWHSQLQSKQPLVTV